MSELELLNTRIKVLEAENELLNAQHDAYENFIWAVLGMFSGGNMTAFNVWITNVLSAIDALPGGDKIREALEAE